MWFELGLRLQQEAMGNSRGYSRRKNEHGPRHRGWKKQGPSPSSAVVPTVLYKSVQGKSRDWPDLTWVVRTEPKTVVPLQSTCYWVQAHTACHMCVCLVTQLCPTVCNPLDYSPPGFSIHGIFQARILEWVATSFSRGSSQSEDRTCISCVSCFVGQYFTHWTIWEVFLSHDRPINQKMNCWGK